MTTAIIILVALATFHFVYESILAPSLRLSLLFRLFALRDEVRARNVGCIDSANDPHFQFLHDSINNLILMLHRIDIASVVAAEFESRKDPGFLAQAQKRALVLDECSTPCVREIRTQTLRIATEALVVNSGAWVVPFLAPWIIASVGYSRTQKRLRVLVSLSSPEVEQISPMGAATAPI